MRAAREDFGSLEELDAEALRRRTEERLEALLRHAVESVPFYQEALARSGLASPRHPSAADLARFPVLTREKVREGARSGELLARGVPRGRRVPTQTTGSTGMPLLFFGDAESRRPRILGWSLLDRWAGVERDDERVWMTVPRPRPAWSVRRPVSSWWRRVRFRQPADLLSVYRLTAADVPGMVQALNRRQAPYFIYGIGSSIHFVAERARATGLRLERPPRAAIGTSDTFVAEQRETVRATFGCPALSRYGAYEVGGGVAQTCPDNPRVHHVLSELVVLEVVGDDLRPVPPGKRGRILLTDLTNRVMPLIRYDIGDLAYAAEACDCGRPWPAIGEIFGRIADRIVTPGGDSFPAWDLETALFYEGDFKGEILEYQFVQRGPGELEMRVVPRRELDPRTLERMRGAIAKVLGEGMDLAVIPVARLETAESGKRRLVVREGGPWPTS